MICRSLEEQVLKNKEDIERLINNGSLDAGDLLKLLTGDETVVVDLAESGQQVEIHLDEHFKQSLATKLDLTGKINADTVYSNDEPMFSDALEVMSSLQEFYQFFYDRRKEPSKTYLIQGQVGLQYDNILSLLNFPSVIGSHKWALLCECLSSEAGGFFIRLSLTTDTHNALYTNLIGGWLSGSKIGLWRDALSKGGLQPVTERSVVYATDAQGRQTTLQYNKTAVGGGLAQRNSDGTLEVATPTRDNDAATKEYVDSHGGGGSVQWELKTPLEFKNLIENVKYKQFYIVVASLYANELGSTYTVFGTISNQKCVLQGQLDTGGLSTVTAYIPYNIGYVKLFKNGTAVKENFDIFTTKYLDKIFVMKAYV